MRRQATRRKRRARTDRGFSLVEVMIAFTVLGIGLLTIAAAQVKAIHGTRAGRHLSDASIVAQSQLDRLAGSSWSDLSVTSWTTPTRVESLVATDEGDLVEQEYQVRWQISDLVTDQTRSVDVRVEWSERDGRQRSVSASTIVFNRQDV